MSDTKPTLTAAEFAAIGERVLKTVSTSTQVYQDRASLYAALERLIDGHIVGTVGNRVAFQIDGVMTFCDTKADAIDALFGGGK
mgnify:CR=1 FL=1